MCFSPPHGIITYHLQGMDAGFISGAFFSFSRAAASMALTAISSLWKQPAATWIFRHPHLVVNGLTPCCSLTLVFGWHFKIVIGRKWKDTPVACLPFSRKAMIMISKIQIVTGKGDSLFQPQTNCAVLLINLNPIHKINHGNIWKHHEDQIGTRQETSVTSY